MIQIEQSTLLKVVDKRKIPSYGIVVCGNFCSEKYQYFAADFFDQNFPLGLLPFVLGKTLDVLFVPCAGYKNFFRKSVLPLANQPLCFQEELLREVSTLNNKYLGLLPWREQVIPESEDCVERNPEKDILDSIFSLEVDDPPNEVDDDDVPF